MDFGARLDAWLLDVVVAARGLLRLYTRLQDPVQRMRADKLERAALERLGRRMQAVTQSLQAREAAMKEGFQGLDEVESERETWRLVFKGVCGIAMLYRFGATQDASLSRLEKAWSKALRIAVEGFVGAFPLDIVREHVHEGFLAATQEAVEATQEDLTKAGAMTQEEACELAEGMRTEFHLDLSAVLDSILLAYRG